MKTTNKSYRRLIAIVVIATRILTSSAAPADSVLVGTTDTSLTDSARMIVPHKPPLLVMDKGIKRVYVHNLGLAPGTKLYEVLQLIPEMLTRGNKEVLRNYSLMIDWQDVSDSKYIVMHQMTIDEIELLEITENATASNTKNGSAGSLNIITRNIKNGLTGNANLIVTTEANILLSSQVNYKTDRLLIQGTLRGEYYGAMTNPIETLQPPSGYWQQRDQYMRRENWGESAQLLMRYTPNERDLFKMQVWQLFGHRRTNAENEYLERDTPDGPYRFWQGASDSVLLAHSLMAIAHYEHAFGAQHRLTAEAGYTYSPYHYNTTESTYRDELDTLYTYGVYREQPHALTGHVFYEGTVWQRGLHSIGSKSGINMDLTLTRATDGRNWTINMTQVNDSLNRLNRGISPYSEWTYRYGNKVTVSTGARYRYDRLRQYEQDRIFHDWMVYGMVSYSPVEAHTMIVSGERSYISPSIYNARGNNIAATGMYVYGRDYGAHHINTEAGIKYSLSRYVNDDRYESLTLWGSAQYRWQWLSLTLATHMRGSLRQEVAGVYYPSYWNIRLTPIFQLPKQWQVSATLLYDSRMKTANEEWSGYFYTSLRVGKQINRWHLNLMLNDPFHYRSTAIVRTDQGEKRTSEYLYTRMLSLGVQYAW